MRKRADGSYSNAWRGVSQMILRPTIRALMKFDWQGQEHFVPPGRGMIVAANHLSYADVLALALFCDQAGRYPTFLAKSSLFKIKVLGPIIAKLGQLPVYRGQADAAFVLRDAEQGVRDGACVVFYPEGTVTRDPAMWPMQSKTGVARLALATGAPVVPVGHWGAQYILPYGSVKPHVIPRKTVHMIAGPPVDLSEFAGQPLDTELRQLAQQAAGAAEAAEPADVARAAEAAGNEEPAGKGGALEDAESGTDTLAGAGPDAAGGDAASEVPRS